MTKYIGRLVNLGVAKESSRGVGASPTYWVPHVTFSFDDKVVKARSVAGVGKIGDSDEAFVTTKYGQGDLEGEIRDKSFGLLLYSMLGTLSTASNGDSTYTHSFSIAQTAQHQSLAFLVQDPNTSEMYRLVMLNSLELNVELNQVVQYKASFMGKQAQSYTTQTATYTAENKFTKKHLVFKIASNLAGLAAATAISVKRLRLTISKNVTMDDVLGTVEPEDFLNRQLSVEGEIELNYEDETYKNYMKNGTVRAVQIQLVNTDTVIGNATQNPTFTLKMPTVDFFDWQPDYARDEIVRQTLSFKGNIDVSGGNDMVSTCQLINAVTSY